MDITEKMVEGVKVAFRECRGSYERIPEYIEEVAGWVIGKGPARNIEVSSQDFDKSFEIIEAGDEVEFQELIYIPTEEEIKMDFGDDATLSNPFFIGGFGVQYTDVTGKHSITAHSIEIKLIGVPSSP